MKITTLALACIGMAFVSTQVLAADYEGASARKGGTRGEACEKAKNSATLSARAAGPRRNTIRTSACECSQVSDSRDYGWECTVAWEATQKEER